jgi:diadenosine tetraphosphate (Ap4A) HIT family hydrolase
MGAFELHPRLAAGGHPLGMLENCRLLLKDNAHFAWFILVPEVGVEELHELSQDDYARLGAAVRQLSGFVSRHFAPDKVNVAAIGNQVRQLHVHVVGRWTHDPAWPGVVWACDARQAYAAQAVERIRGLLEQDLGCRASC